MFIMEEKQNKSKAHICIVGVGGGGSNAVETMIKEDIQGVQFVAVNTDDQALSGSSAKTKIQLGSKLTKGLGAGADPEVGRRAAIESYEDIVKILKGVDMVFVTAGMGGGTGTGGAPLIAQAAVEMGILTVGIVTKPFLFEGQKRMRQAEKGIRELRNYVDTLIVIPNEKLLCLVEKNTPLTETFKMTDNILLKAVKGIADLINIPGLINLDFADIKTVMRNKGMALMGRGQAEGADRAKKATHLAVSSPLLEGVSINGATGMIVNITAHSSLSLVEVQEASAILTQSADDSADIIVGTVIDKNMGDKLSVTVIATGFPGGEPETFNKSLLSFNAESSAEMAPEQKLDPMKTYSKPVLDKGVAQLPQAKEVFVRVVEPFQEGDVSAGAIESPSTEEVSVGAVEPSQVRDVSVETVEPLKTEDSVKLCQDQADNSSVDKKEEEFPSSAPEASFEDKADNAKEQPRLQEGEQAQPANAETVSNLKGLSDSVQANQENLLTPNPLADSFKPESEQKKTNKPISLKEMLILKAKKYQNQKAGEQSESSQDNQISMDWKDSSLEESLASPFESSMDFSEEDMKT